MRTLIATLLTYANADETSLMQDRVKHMASTQLSTYGDVSSTESRHDSTSRLLETAEKMIKNGVTPDVIIFVDAIVAEINDVVLPAILEEHQEDQNYIDELCARFTAAVDRLRADTEDMMVFSEAQSVAIGGRASLVSPTPVGIQGQALCLFDACLLALQGP